MLNMLGGSYGTPLQAARYANHSALVMHLVDLGAEVNMSGGRFGSALGAAAYSGNLKICKHLLDNSARIDWTNHYNRTPIYFASVNGYIGVVKLLLDQGADLSAANLQSATNLCGNDQHIILDGTPWLVANSMYGAGSMVGTSCTYYDHLEGNRVVWSSTTNIQNVKGTCVISCSAVEITT